MDKNAQITELFEEAIKLERSVAALYLTYARLFPEHGEFWARLSQEEENHAAIIRSGMEQLYQFDLFPLQALATDVGSIKRNCQEIKDKIELFEISPPDLKSACEFAISIENGAGESHYQVTIDSAEKSRALIIFKNMASNDKDHADRIRKFLEETRGD